MTERPLATKSKLGVPGGANQPANRKGGLVALEYVSASQTGLGIVHSVPSIAVSVSRWDFLPASVNGPVLEEDCCLRWIVRG
jgi:hypothetical protein